MDITGVYEKIIILIKNGGTLKKVYSHNISGIPTMTMVYSRNTELEYVRVECSSISEAGLLEFREMTKRILGVCGNSSVERNNIYAYKCSCCGELFFSDRFILSTGNIQCKECTQIEMKNIDNVSIDGAVSFVYLIANDESKKLKIGFSNNPQKRLQSLKTGAGADIYIAGLIKGGQKLEKKIHKTFSYARINGEWFSDKEEIREFFKNYKYSD